MYGPWLDIGWWYINLADHEQGVVDAKNNMRIYWLYIVFCRIKDNVVNGKTGEIMHRYND